MIPTLWSLFFESEALPIGAARRIAECDEMEALRRRLQADVDPTFQASADRAVQDGLRQMLDASLLDVLVRSWARHPEVERQIVERRDGPAIVLLDLGEHEIASRHRPRIDIRRGPELLASLEFGVRMDLMIQRARLHLQGDRLLRATLGACQGHGRLSVGEEEIAAFAWREIRMPTEVSFGAGVPFGPGVPGLVTAAGF